MFNFKHFISTLCTSWFIDFRNKKKKFDVGSIPNYIIYKYSFSFLFFRYEYNDPYAVPNVILTSAMSSLENLSEFVLEPGPEDCLVRCRVTRNNKGIDKGKEELSEVDEKEYSRFLAVGISWRSDNVTQFGKNHWKSIFNHSSFCFGDICKMIMTFGYSLIFNVFSIF